jgi:hypothetical protein
MIAPLITPANDRGDADTAHVKGMLEGAARHVSSEGCQFVMSGKAPGLGRRLRVAAGPQWAITGTVRWVVGERIGFAFDQRIDAAAVIALADHFACARVIELLPCLPDRQEG